MAKDVAAPVPIPAPPEECQLVLTPDEYQLLEETKRAMAIAQTDADAVLLSVKFVGWILSLRQQGYKMAMVKGSHVEPLQGLEAAARRGITGSEGDPPSYSAAAAASTTAWRSSSV